MDPTELECLGMFRDDLHELVPVAGCIHLATDLGIFLEVQNHHVFVPANFPTLGTPRNLTAGARVTVLVSRRFAEREGLLVQPD